MGKPKLLVWASASVLMLSLAPPSFAQTGESLADQVAYAEQVSLADRYSLQVQPDETLNSQEPGFDKNNVDNQAGANWNPTLKPQAEIIPGKMRSDREEIPGGFTKEEADLAELQEAQEQAAALGEGPSLRSAAAHCSTYWPSPYQVCGAIREKYDAMGGPRSFLTWPKSNELGVPDGVGRRNEFLNGHIYWHPDTGAHSVSTHFATVWARNGWEAGRMGYPTSDEYVAADGVGRRQDFQDWHIMGSLAGMAAIGGAIFDKWVELGAELGPLSYPLNDETATADGTGRYNNFLGGVIFWHPQYGAHDVSGVPLLIWSKSGYEQGQWGYPTSSASHRGDFPIATYQEFSKKPMDVTKEIVDTGDTLVNGKPINDFLLEVLETHGISIADDDAGRASLRDGLQGLKETQLTASECPLPNSTSPDYGGISIPGHYDYWACQSGYRHREHYARHDFCTKSPDAVLLGGTKANFRGARARHDLCMDASPGKYGGCNRQLYDDMETICTDRYAAYDPSRYRCRDLRNTYWVFVTGTHLGQL